MTANAHTEPTTVTYVNLQDSRRMSTQDVCRLPRCRRLHCQATCDVSVATLPAAATAAAAAADTRLARVGVRLALKCQPHPTRDASGRSLSVIDR